VAARREIVPPAADYYEVRHDYLNQGDIFREVPLAYPFLGEDAETDDAGVRRFHSGPIAGLALLITPTCSMQAQGQRPGIYAHPVRALVPVIPLQQLIDEGSIKEAAAEQLRQYDNLINYMFLPSSTAYAIEESLALLWLPMSLHHEQIVGQRVAQLSRAAAQQLQRKLQWFYTSLVDPREEFDPQLD
jgi:hypothetical protein